MNPGRCTICYYRAAPGIDKVSELYPEDIFRNLVDVLANSKGATPEQNLKILISYDVVDFNRQARP